MLISVIDLGINNLTSVINSFSRPLNSNDFIEVFNPSSTSPDLLILPGLGKFSAGMEALQSNNMNFRIVELVNSGTKLIGICLGMQLLSERSAESPDNLGLGLIEGHCEKLPYRQGNPVPHTGWESIKVSSTNLFSSLNSGRDFYFVHSYHLIPQNKEDIAGITSFGNYSFTSVVQKNNILGVQFHPEKSGQAGIDLVSEIVAWAR
jgi:imidazole glycerol phosphate synthase glutamine amidotransferase subunit